MAEDLVKKISERDFDAEMASNLAEIVRISVQAGKDEAAASLAAKDKEIDRLTKRLDLLAVCFGVPDGGRYIADWQTRIAKYKSAESRAEQAERAYRDLTSYIEGWTSTGELKQRAGEMTAQEVRTVQAVLSAILDKARTAARAFVAQHGSDSREGK